MGALEVTSDGARSVVRSAWAKPPLVLVPTKNHGHAAWVFVASLGGGFVDGDRAALSLDVGDGATALLATQASTKVYRSPRGCTQRVSARVGARGLLAVLPEPVVCFAGARFEQTTEVALAADASLVWLEAMTAGRSASGEHWDFARYLSGVRVTVDGEVRLSERLELDPAHGDLGGRMGRFAAFATLLAVGPRAQAIVTDGVVDGVVVSAGAAPAGLGGVVVRFAARSAEALGQAVRARLGGLAAALGDDPFARRW